MQVGSVFICNFNIALHVSDASWVHLQEHLETVEAASGEWDAARYKANKQEYIQVVLELQDKLQYSTRLH